MVCDTISQKISLLQLQARRLLKGQNIGKNIQRLRSAQADFEQLREYCAGDDIRFIDWKSSARGQKLVVRTYQEERDRTVFLLVDMSRSALFGSGESTKENIVRDCAALIACAAGNMRDKVGAILFHEKVHTVIHPRAQGDHIITMMHTLLKTPFSGAGTAFSDAVQSGLELLGRKRSLLVVVSDCLNSEYAKMLPLAAAMHDVVVIRVQDTLEKEISTAMFMQLQDIETGDCFDINSIQQINAMQDFVMNWIKEQDVFFQQQGIDCVNVTPDSALDETLIHFFNTRVRR